MLPHRARTNQVAQTLSQLTYWNADHADGTRLGPVLLEKLDSGDHDLADTQQIDNLRRTLRRAIEDASNVSIWTADEWCVRVGIHPMQLPADVWTVRRTRAERGLGPSNSTLQKRAQKARREPVAA